MITIDNILLEWSYRCSDGIVDLNNPQKKAILEQILNELGLEDTQEITEVSLSPTQLEKPFPPKSDLSSQYKDRGEKFLDKIINNEDFTLNNGNTIKLDIDASSEAIKLLQNKDYKSLGKGAKLLVDTTGKEYSLAQFKKTEEFGSGKGSGAGAANTALQESTQCLANAIAYRVKNAPITKEDINDENIEEALKYIDVTSSLDEMKSFLKDPSWIKTFVNTANVLLAQFYNPNFEFHRGSSFTNSIYNAYKISSKLEDISMQSDKWNPADIWMVSPSVKSITFPTDLKELNGLIAELLASDKLIGVSLKKLGDTAKISLYNMTGEELEGYSYEGPPISTNKSKEAKLKYNKGVIAFRTFNYATNFAGEIQGKTAAHGKVGIGAINDALKFNQLSVLPSTQELKSKFEDNDEILINDFYNIYNNIVENISEEDFNDIINSKDIDWKVSKYLSLKICDTINAASSSTQDEFISDLIRYASSSTKVSSAFVKIS
jgi:hypothetical protein